ncbi:hypothetical protein [Microlunatus flavus]|uniref:Uncharacterized protein n=1 Tax=Microlunatus flavus TaxID=1036181 RepID=A0A1H9DKU4_9ACTN|nr:hypothetical protein [Microlunatus flavus]SEQ14031.1 hypothetical protein SAMN05421756_102575 [Microlunatus flavus]
MPDELPTPTTLVGQVALALGGAGAREDAVTDLATRRRALMYAEAIDDADEADAVLRYGPRLRACLDTLGVALDVAA